MKMKKFVELMFITFAIMLASTAVHAQAFRSHQFCSDLADIGASAYNVKRAGYSMEEVLNRVSPMLASDKQKQQAAEGVIMIIYGDSSIRSAKQARKIVYSGCRQ